jgi:hypothetical protein
MNPIAVGLITFACLFGAALLGMRLREALPEHHMSEDSRHLLQTGLGIIGTMAGLVLGLLVASATSSYNAQRAELDDVSSKVVLLDRVLEHYGPEAGASRRVLRQTVRRALAAIWPQESSSGPHLTPLTGAEALLDEVGGLSPKSELQKTLKPDAMGLVMNLAQIRWLMYEQADTSVSLPLLILLVFWFTITFIGFGLFAPWNATTIVALALCALAVSGAVIVMLEMYAPFEGFMQISAAPLREALAHLGR